MIFFIPALLVAAFVLSLMPLAQFEAQSFFLAFLFAVGAVAAGIYALPSAQGLRIPKSGVMIPAAAFWALALWSVTFSQAQSVSFIYFCFFSLFPLVLMAVLLAPNRDALFKITGVALAVIFAALALVSIVQFFFFPGMLPDHGRAQWPLANPNSLGALYVMGFFCVLGGMLGAKTRVHSNLALVLAVVVIAGIFTTGSRGALLALAAGLAPFMVFAPAYFKIHRRCFGALIMCAALGFAAVTFLAPASTYSLADTIGYSLSTAPPVPMMRERPALWGSTWAIIGDHFWTGTGIGTFFLYYPQYRGADYTTAGFMAHNDPLQFWAEMGILAPLLFYVFAVVALLRTLKVLKILPADDIRRIYILAPACAFVAVIIHCHITFHFYVLPILFLSGALLAFWYDQVQKILPVTYIFIPAKHSTILKFFALAPLAALLFGFVTIHGSYLLTQQAQDRLARGDINAFAADLNRANAIAPGRNERAYILAAAIPMGIIDSQGKALPSGEAEKLFEQADGLLDIAWALNPRLAAILYYKARLRRAVSGLLPVQGGETPEELLGRALALDPLHVSSRLLLADIYEEQGENEKSWALIRDGMKWDEVYADPLPYLKRAELAARNHGHKDDARRAAELVEKHEQMHNQALAQQGGYFASAGFRDFMPAQSAPGPTQKILIDSLEKTLRGQAQEQE